MSYFLEITDAKETSNSTPSVLDVTNMIPILTMHCGMEKEIQQGAYESIACSPQASELVLTKFACSNSPDLMEQTGQRKTKNIRIYAMESVGSNNGIPASLSTMNLKTVYEFGNAHFTSMNFSGSNPNGDLVETITAVYTKFSIRHVSGASSKSKSFDFIKGKSIE